MLRVLATQDQASNATDYECDVSVSKPQHNTGGFHQLSERKSFEVLCKGLVSRRPQGGCVDRRTPLPAEDITAAGRAGIARILGWYQREWLKAPFAKALRQERAYR